MEPTPSSREKEKFQSPNEKMESPNPNEKMKAWLSSSTTAESFNGLAHPGRETTEQRQARFEDATRKCEERLAK